MDWLVAKYKHPHMNPQQSRANFPHLPLHLYASDQPIWRKLCAFPA
jgi:hypothetical protein